MAQLEINVPFETDQSTIKVEVDPRKPLSRGRQVYQLQVVDDSGNVSEATTLIVIVADQERPTAILQGPQIVNVGASFELTGAKSFDIGGEIKSYRFTYLGPQL